jgi:hypothetical protein
VRHSVRNLGYLYVLWTNRRRDCGNINERKTMATTAKHRDRRANAIFLEKHNTAFSCLSYYRASHLLCLTIFRGAMKNQISLVSMIQSRCSTRVEPDNSALVRCRFKPRVPNSLLIARAARSQSRLVATIPTFAGQTRKSSRYRRNRYPSPVRSWNTNGTISCVNHIGLRPQPNGWAPQR